jgi:hypothetical protein
LFKQLNIAVARKFIKKSKTDRLKLQASRPLAVMRGEQAALVPARIAARTEEVGAHIVVHAADFPAELAKVGHDFGTDEARRTGDKKFIHR